MPSYTYRVGILPWTLTLNGDRLTVGAAWGRREVVLGRVQKVGIACSRYDAAGLALPAPWQKRACRIEVGETPVPLPPGPAGLVLTYEDDAGRTRDVAATFPAADPEAVALVQTVLDAVPADRFVGVGGTVEVRALMGLGGGDFVAGVVMFLVLGAAVAGLMALGVI